MENLKTQQKSPQTPQNLNVNKPIINVSNLLCKSDSLGNYVTTSEPTREHPSCNSNHAHKEQDIRDGKVLELRDLNYHPLGHLTMATLRRLKPLPGIYNVDFPCFPIKDCPGNQILLRLCNRWLRSGTILCMIQEPSLRMAFLHTLFTTRKLPIIFKLQDRFKFNNYELTRNEKKACNYLRQFSPTFWKFLHTVDIQAHGLTSGLKTLGVSLCQFGMGGILHCVSPGLGDYLFVSGFGTACFGLADVASDKMVQVVCSTIASAFTRKVSAFYTWVLNLFARFDTACANTFGTGWSSLPHYARVILVCVISAGTISIAIAGSKLLYKMFSEMLSCTTVETTSGIEAHAQGPLETGVIAALCAAFVLTGSFADSSRSFALFNTMNRSLALAADGMAGVFPIRESINAMFEAVGQVGPFTLITIQKDLTDFDNDCSSLLDDPRFKTLIRTDPSLPLKLKKLKERGKDLKDTIAYTSTIHGTVKTKLFSNIVRLCRAHTECVSINERYCRRPYPVWLEMRGAPGQGKTEINSIVTKAVFKKIFGREMTTLDYFSKTPGSPYWSAYDPETCWATFMDEFLTTTCVSVNQPEASALLSMIGTEYCPLDMPDIESKGVTAFRSSMVVTTGNGNFETTGLTDAGALRRRIAFPMKATKNKILGDKPTLDDFSKAWVIELNDDFYANEADYDGVYHEIKFQRLFAASTMDVNNKPRRPSWNLLEFIDIVTRSVQEASSKPTLYEKFIEAQASEVTMEFSAIYGKKCMFSFSTMDEDYTYEIKDSSVIRVARHEFEEKFDNLVLAIAHASGRDIRTITVDVTEDYTSISDGVTKDKVDYCVSGPSGYLTEDDVFNHVLFPTPPINKGPLISFGNGSIGVVTLTELLHVRRDLELYRYGRCFDLAKSKVADFMSSRIRLKSTLYEVKHSVQKYALPIAIAAGLLIGAASLVASVVTLYTGVDIEPHSDEKGKIKPVKVKEKVIPKFIPPPTVAAHSASNDALSLFPNIRKIQCSGTGMTCWAIFVTDSVMITVAHILRNKGLIKLFDTCGDTYSTLGESDYESLRIEDSDFGVIFLRRPKTGVKNIMKRFCRSPMAVGYG